MNKNKIAFIICVLDENQYIRCSSCINNLEIPTGIQVDVISVREKNNIAQAYNIGASLTDAKYKVYLHSNTYILNRSMIKDVIDIFSNDSKIGLIGVVGAKRLPESGVWWNDIGKVGEVKILRNGTNEYYYKLNNVIEKYEIVEAVDGLIMATQFDINWREEVFDSLFFYDISQCMEFKKKGFQIVVPRQENTWCIHDEGVGVNSNFGNDAEKYRSILLREYPIIKDRNIFESEDLFAFNREEGMNILIQNRKMLEEYVSLMKSSLISGDYESVARYAHSFATKTSWNSYHPGFYQSPEIENMLLECADKLQVENNIIKRNSRGKRQVLHVISEGYSVGGHTRLAKNWIKSDKDSVHSLITTWQIGSAPQWILDEVKESGGWTFSLETVSDKFIERAAKLRKLAYEWADIVVLHIHMMDPIPVMAFGLDGGPPIIYMNHGDHCFWLGASIADLVVDLRPSGQKLTLTRRSCRNSFILPIPLQPKKDYERNEIRQKYGIDSNETVILTIASNYKFRSLNNYNYINIINDVVKKVENCRVYIIGPKDIGKWHEINVETNGKIKALGVLTDIEELYQIADIYLDCFMIGSMTSLLDASKYGIPIIKFANRHCPILTEYDDEFEVCTFNNLNDIIQEINEIKNCNTETCLKHDKITDSIVKNHILETKEKIQAIYDSVDNHTVNRELKISNNTEDYDLFWSLLISRGYVF